MDDDEYCWWDDLPDWWNDVGITQILEADNERLLIKFIENKLEDLRSTPQRLLHCILSWCPPPVRCLEALVTGQTPLIVDLNLPCTDSGIYPIHLAADNFDDTAILELLLYYGARADTPLPNSPNEFQHFGPKALPLQIALHKMEELFLIYDFIEEWKPLKSKYNFLSFLLPLCRPVNQIPLEGIALLAGKTKETEKLFLEYAMQGKIIEFASLLIVAHKRVYGIMDRVREHFDSVDHKEDDMRERVLCMQQLVEVFDRSGNEISAYVKRDRSMVSCPDTVIDVLSLIQKDGCSLPPLESDVDLRHYIRLFNRYRNSKPGEPSGLRNIVDFGMTHYSKSGYRWKVSKKDIALKINNVQAYLNELQNEINSLKGENVKIIRKQQQPKLRISMDEELRTALQEDDKDRFLCLIDGNVEFFCSRQQQLLYAVCESSSIKCAEALISGESRLSVDLNLPCTDTGLYPLHCAALCFLPSMTELFLYNGACTDVRTSQRNLSYSFPQYELAAHDDKLPLHMALLGISRLPCIREWTPKQSICKLVTLFCLPRMQNALETLCLLANMTKGMSDEFIRCAIDGKFVELAALLIVADDNARKNLLVRIKELVMTSDVISHDQREKIMELAKVVERSEIWFYIFEEKYHVTKYQVIENVTHLLKSYGLLSCSSDDTDLSVYNWYREEEFSYPSKAPYEDVRLLHDIGMDHYSKLQYRWEVRDRERYWLCPVVQAEMKKLEDELEYLKKEKTVAEEKQKQEVRASGFPFVIHHGVHLASLDLFSHDVVVKDRVAFSHDVVNDKVVDRRPWLGNSHKVCSTRIMASMPSPSSLCDFPNADSTRTLFAFSLGKPKTCLTLGRVGGTCKQRQGGHGFGLYVRRPWPPAIPSHGFICGCGISYKCHPF